MAITDNTQFGRVGAFRFWCQKVLPAVYDDSLSYYELLCKVTKWLEDLTEITNTQSDAITELQETLTEFMAGTFDPYIEQKVDDWFDAHEPQLSNDVEQLKLDMTAAQGDITILKDMEGFALANYEIFSDDSAFAGGSTETVWTYFNDILNEPTLNFNVHTAPIDTGWVSQNENLQDADDYLVQIATSQTSDYRESINYVILNFGYYDILNNVSGDYETAGRTIVNRASNYYPNAIVIVNPISNNYCYGYNRPMQLNFYNLNYGMARSQVPIRIIPWFVAFNINQLASTHYYDSMNANPCVLNGGGVESVGAMIKMALFGCESAYQRGTRSNLNNYLDSDYLTSSNTEFMYDVETQHVSLSAGYMTVQQTISNYETEVGEITNPAWTVDGDIILAICIQNTSSDPMKGWLVLGNDDKIYFRTNGTLTVNNGAVLRLMPCASYEPAFRKI